MADAVSTTPKQGKNGPDGKGGGTKHTTRPMPTKPKQ